MLKNVTLSRLLLEFITKAPFIVKKAILFTPAVYKLITSLSRMLLHFCNGRESSQLRPLEFWNRPLLNERDYHRSYPLRYYGRYICFTHRKCNVSFWDKRRDIKAFRQGVWNVGEMIWMIVS